jgi:hypothetical protein
MHRGEGCEWEDGGAVGGGADLELGRVVSVVRGGWVRMSDHGYAGRAWRALGIAWMRRDTVGAVGRLERTSSLTPSLFLPSAGKSSIRKVVFERMAPSDTLFIEKTAKSSSDDIKYVPHLPFLRPVSD